jgi:hypothetical protein
LPRWAAAYDGRLHALARAAAAELVAVRLLASDPDAADQWLPTPGIHLWRASVRQPPAPAHDDTPKPTALDIGTDRPGAGGSMPPSPHHPLPTG